MGGHLWCTLETPNKVTSESRRRLELVLTFSKTRLRSLVSQDRGRQLAFSDALPAVWNVEPPYAVVARERDPHPGTWTGVSEFLAPLSLLFVQQRRYIRLRTRFKSSKAVPQHLAVAAHSRRATWMLHQDISAPLSQHIDRMARGSSAGNNTSGSCARSFVMHTILAPRLEKRTVQLGLTRNHRRECMGSCPPNIISVGGLPDSSGRVLREHTPCSTAVLRVSTWVGA